MAGRNPSVDWVALKREYVFSEPPISLTDLAEKHGVARSGLAAKAAGAKDEVSWYDEREEFRRRLGEKTLSALADKWASFETANREKRMETANAALDAFIQDLKDGKAKIGSKDAIEWIRLMRDEFEDVRNIGRSGQVIDGEATETFDSDEAARQAMDQAIRLLNSGEEDAASSRPAS